jgi:hypothetical protein
MGISHSKLTDFCSSSLLSLTPRLAQSLVNIIHGLVMGGGWSTVLRCCEIRVSTGDLCCTCIVWTCACGSLLKYILQSSKGWRGVSALVE